MIRIAVEKVSQTKTLEIFALCVRVCYWKTQDSILLDQVTATTPSLCVLLEKSVPQRQKKLQSTPRTNYDSVFSHMWAGKM